MHGLALGFQAQAFGPFEGFTGLIPDDLPRQHSFRDRQRRHPPDGEDDGVAGVVAAADLTAHGGVPVTGGQFETGEVFERSNIGLLPIPAAGDHALGIERQPQ